MQSKYIALLLVSFFLSLPANAQQVYENDETGRKLQGELNNLISAVTDGKEIAVGYLRGNGLVTWRRSCDSVVVQNNVVECFVLLVPDTDRVAYGREFRIPFFFEQHIFRSNGASSFIKFDLEKGTIVKSQKGSPLGLKWFVNN